MRAPYPAILLSLLVLTGCAAPQAARQAAAPSQAASTEATFERRVYPFPVYSPHGSPYTHPFLGGLNQPRPQFVDIDGDGDLDLFVQERTDRLIFFENTGDAGSPVFTWRSDRYQNLEVGDWFRFADIDADGDADLLAEQRYSYVRYYENTGANGRPSFTLAADTLKEADGTPIFSDRQNIPNVTDLDCDGLLDLFIGRLDGTVSRYEEVDRNERGVPIFELVTDRFENIQIVTQITQPGLPPPPIPGGPAGGPAGAGSFPGSGNRPTRHGANTLVFYDYDADDDPDLFWGDFFEPGLLLIENTGSCEAPSLREEPISFPIMNPLVSTGYNAPAFADLDGDGDQDLTVGVLGGAYNPNRSDRENLYYYEQTDVGRYALRTRQLLPSLDVGSESATALGDLDGDGDLDMLIGNKLVVGETQTAHLYLLRNEGTDTQPSFVFADTIATAAAYNYAPELGDLDGDGDLDLLLGTWNDGIAYYRNTGTRSEPRFELVANGFVRLTRGSHSTPALVDIDADGDLDLFVGETSGDLNFYRNTGSPTNPVFELESDTYADINVGRRSAPTFMDIDGDGDFDLLIGTARDGLVLFRNTGTPQEPSFEQDLDFTLDAPDVASPVFADMDGDGDPDLFIGSVAGGLIYYENTSP